MVHIRRHWEQASGENRQAASWFLGKIRDIYRIEHECDARGLDADARRSERQSRMKPIMEEMKEWMETEGVHYSERTLTGQAVTYAYARWENMMRVLEDGRLKLDNNLAENEIRPITLGRKNYLFCGNHDAAVRAAIVYSFFSSCKAHNVDVRLWLEDTLKRIPSEKAIDQLLPCNWQVLTANSR